MIPDFNKLRISRISNMNNMNKLILLLSLLLSQLSFSQKIMSWNIQNLGESKFKKDSIIPQIYQVIKSTNADIIAIQEVSINKYGDSCIIELAKLLNYNWTISLRTTGDGSERYAFLYRKSFKLKWSKLDKSIEDSINREPFMACFIIKKKELIIRQVHLVPISKNPESEVNKIYYSDGIICGDFNLSCENDSFKQLKSKFNSSNCSNSTSLKRNGDISENSYDHFFVDRSYRIKKSEVYFYPYLWNKNILSDHLPILINIEKK